MSLQTLGLGLSIPQKLYESESALSELAKKKNIQDDAFSIAIQKLSHL